MYYFAKFIGVFTFFSLSKKKMCKSSRQLINRYAQILYYGSWHVVGHKKENKHNNRKISNIPTLKIGHCSEIVFYWPVKAAVSRTERRGDLA